MTLLSWVALHGMAHSFTELDKAVIHVISLVFCHCGFHSVCCLMNKNQRLVEASGWEGLVVRESGFCSDGWGMLRKSLIQFSIDGRIGGGVWGWVVLPPCSFA